MPYVVVLLIVAVALGRGGYSRWATLALELGALGLLAQVLLQVLWRTRPAERAREVVVA